MPITVIGLGLDYANLPPQTAARIAKATVLVGGEAHLRHFAEHEAIKVRISTPLVGVINAINNYDKEDHEIVVSWPPAILCFSASAAPWCRNWDRGAWTLFPM